MTVSRRFSWLAGLVILLLAALLRAPSLVAAKPYINYVDEGSYLDPVANMLRAGDWDPHWYLYPQLPVTLAAAGARLYAPFHPLRHDGRTFYQDLPPQRAVYDTLEPFELLLIGRLLSFLASLGLVVVTGLYGRRLLGLPSGLFAAFLAAWLPSLVTRGSIATVDPWAALFALACFFFADRVRTSRHPGREVFLAGAMAGLAFASKYPAVVAAGGAGLTLLLEESTWRDKWRWCALGTAGILAGMIAGMPAVLLHPQDVMRSISFQNQFYNDFLPITPRLWEQAIVRAEWDLPYDHPELGIPFLLLATAGAVVALRDRRLAKTVAGWLLFLGISLILYLPKNFQAFRNLLPHMPLLCLLVAVLHARIRERLARPVWADAGAVLLVLTLFAQPVAWWARERAALEDSRGEVVGWLAEHAGPNDSVLVLWELGFVPEELDRLEGKVMRLRWPQSLPAIRARSPKFLVVGPLERENALPLDATKHPAVRRGYRLRARFGETLTPLVPGVWKGNRQVVCVLEKKVRRGKGKGKGRPAAAPSSGPSSGGITERRSRP